MGKIEIRDRGVPYADSLEREDGGVSFPVSLLTKRRLFLPCFSFDQTVNQYCALFTASDKREKSLTCPYCLYYWYTSNNPPIYREYLVSVF